MATLLAQFPTLNKTLHQRRQTTPAPPLSSSSKKNASVSAAPTNSAKTRHVGTVNKKIKSALSARFKNLDASIKTAAADAFGSGLAGSSRKPTIVAMTTEKLPKSKDAAATTAKLKSAKKSIEAFMNIDFGEEENDNDSVLNLHDDRDSNNEDFDDAEDLLASAIARGSDNSDDNDDDDDDDGENGDSDDLEIDEIMRNGGGFFANRPEKETVAVALMKKKKKTASVPVVNNASAAVVTVDVNMSRGPRVGGGREWRAVMASDVRKMNLDAKPKAETTTASRETAEQDRDDDEKDRELMDLLKTSKLIEEFNDSHLFGVDRRKRFEEKLFDLGAKKPSAPKMPFPMRLAAIDTTTRREKARIEAAKESGDFHSSLKTMILSGGDKEKAKKIVAKNRKSGGGGKKRSGIDEGNGKFRGGTLHISKKAADVVSKMGAGQKGRGRSIGMGIKITGVSSGGGSVGKKKGGKKFKKKR